MPDTTATVSMLNELLAAHRYLTLRRTPVEA